MSEARRDRSESGAPLWPREAGRAALRGGRLLAATLLLSVVACDAGEVDTDSGNPRLDSSVLQGRDSVMPYQVSDSSAFESGTLAVRVSADADTPSDTSIFPIRDFDSCGAELTDNSIQRSGTALGGAVVWLRGVSSGKEMPARRRFELTHEDCLLTPRTQAVSTGGTLNLRNLDNAVHVLRLTDARTGEVLARVTQSERGQVVPVEYILDVPRLIEVACESHPWTKGWIHVFNHPYASTSDRSGSAILDSIPAGSHELVVWHERLGEVTSRIVVTAGGRDSIDVRLRASVR